MLKKILLLTFIILLFSKLEAQNPFGKALTLNGDKQYFEIPDQDYLNPDATRDLTIEFWFKPKEVSPTTIISKWKVGSNAGPFFTGKGFLIDIFKTSSKFNGKLRMEYIDPLEGFPCGGSVSRTIGDCINDNDGGGMSEYWSSETINTDTWYHLAYVFDPDEKEVIYLNGITAISYPIRRNNLSTPGEALYLCGFPLPVDSTLDSSYYFNGQIDEVRIWNKVRSASEIRETMDDTLGADYYRNPESGLIAYYRFEKTENLGIGSDNSVDDIRDLTYNENHGDLTGNPNLEDQNSVTVNQEQNKAVFGYELRQNYPNPFNPETKINYSLPKSGPVKITIYDVLGRIVEVVEESNMQAGNHEMKWMANGLSSGIYLCHIKAEGYENTIKMVLEK